MAARDQVTNAWVYGVLCCMSKLQELLDTLYTHDNLHKAARVFSKNNTKNKVVFCTTMIQW